MNLSSKGHSREAEHSFIFFSGIKLNTYFTQEPSCLVFAMFPYPVINCQGLSNLLGLLAVRLNELEMADAHLQQQQKNLF